MFDKIQQFIYTSSPWNLGNGGYGIFTKSAGIGLDLAKMYCGLFSYSIPNGVEDNVSGYPVTYAAVHIPERSFCLVGTSRYLGKRWYENRGGDYISHVLMIPDEFFPFSFSSLYHSGYFWQEVPEELRQRALEYMRSPFEEEPPALDEISRDSFLEILERGKEKAAANLKQVSKEVRCDEFSQFFEKALEPSDECGIQINLSSSSLRNVMEYLPDFLPSNLRCSINFETFACNKNQKNTVFSGILGKCSTVSTQETTIDEIVDLLGLLSFAEEWDALEKPSKENSIQDFKETAKFLFMTQNGVPLELMPHRLLAKRDDTYEKLLSILKATIDAKTNGWDARMLLAKCVYGFEFPEETLLKAETSLVAHTSLDMLLPFFDGLPRGIEKQAELLTMLSRAAAHGNEHFQEQCQDILSKHLILTEKLLRSTKDSDGPIGVLAAEAIAIRYLNASEAPSPLEAEIRDALCQYNESALVEAALTCQEFQEKLTSGEITSKEFSLGLEMLKSRLVDRNEPLCLWLLPLVASYPLTVEDFAVLYEIFGKTDIGYHAFFQAFLPNGGGIPFNYLVDQ